jgi:hypothetical protein
MLRKTVVLVVGQQAIRLSRQASVQELDRYRQVGRSRPDSARREVPCHPAPGAQSSHPVRLGAGTA